MSSASVSNWSHFPRPSVPIPIFHSHLALPSIAPQFPYWFTIRCFLNEDRQLFPESVYRTFTFSNPKAIPKTILMSSAKKEKANLARIRDNQRRSRARRKEYLQELEARLRQCELQGIEASSEIQMAARRVADENKKLRMLLSQHGVGEDNIDAYLQTSPTDAMMGGAYASSSGAVQLLEQLLQTRKACCVDGNNPAQNLGGTGSRDSSASVGTVSTWDPVYAQNTGGRRRSGTWQPIGGKAASSAQQFMTPSNSTASRTSSAVSMGPNSHRGMAHHPRLAPVLQMARNPSPVNGTHSSQGNMFDFDSQLGMSNAYTSHQKTAEQHLQPHPSQAPHRSSIYMPTTQGGVHDCNYATDIITTMAGVDPSVVRSDLGCAPGMNCEVDNHLVFNVMDRYSGVGL